MSNEDDGHSKTADKEEQGGRKDVAEPVEKGSSEEKPAAEHINLQQMEQLEEAKLKARYPQAMRPGGSAFLQKRLNKGLKYFDSGDYNMAKSNKSRVQILQQPTGEAIPTPDNLPTRKTSLVQSKLAAGLS